MIEEEEWRRILDINLTGSFFVAQATCRRMARRQRGVVINMSSKNGLDAEFGYAHYNASKAGVILLTKTMAVELAHLNIRVNAVCPGYLAPPMSMEIDNPEFVRDFVERYIPINRPGSVADVAPMFLFLAGDESAFITGQVFVINSGQLAGPKDTAGEFQRLLNPGPLPIAHWPLSIVEQVKLVPPLLNNGQLPMGNGQCRVRRQYPESPHSSFWKKLYELR